MKRLLALVLIVMMLSGCAITTAIREERLLTPEEQEELLVETVWFAAQLGINIALWNNGLPDLNGQLPPDWWGNGD